MIKNIVIIGFVAAMMSSCSMSLTGKTSSQEFNANVTIVPVTPFKK